MWASDTFFYKTFYHRYFYFYKKIPKENILLHEEVSSQSAEKEFLALIKRRNRNRQIVVFHLI